MNEDLILEVARWAREAEAVVAAKLAAGQKGEAFNPKESSMSTLRKFAAAAVVALAAFTAAPAHAASLVTYSRDAGLTILLGDNPAGSTARIIHAPAASDSSRHARWVAFCHPTATTDDLGVETLHYTHTGCEFGRDH